MPLILNYLFTRTHAILFKTRYNKSFNLSKHILLNGYKVVGGLDWHSIFYKYNS